MLQGTLVFVIFLGPLIFFHELGHFLFARLCGVRVETFSIGFGPKLFRFKRGDTDYAISLIPLGGYVKMFGDDPTTKDEITEEEKQFAFTHKNKWQRFWIVFGGPFANFILAFVIYYFLLVVGESVPQVKVGVVDQNTTFYSMGLRTGDVIKKINKTEISSLEDLNLADEKVDSIEIERGSENLKLNVDAFTKDFVETFIGLDQFFRKPIVVDNKNNAYFLSLTDKIDEKISFEEIISMNISKINLLPISFDGKKVLYVPKIGTKGLDRYSVDDINATGEQVIRLNVEGNLYESLDKAGFYPIDVVVESLVLESPADKAKIKKGDILLAINGNNIHDFNTLRNEIQTLAKAKKEVNLKYKRGNEVFTTKLTPEKKEMNGVEYFAIGIYSSAKVADRQMVDAKPKGLFESFGLATTKTFDGMVSVLIGFKKLFIGSVSMKNLGGPIAIAKQASYSLDISLSYFFKMMALISINLGILNLLPIPILDGGHILFILIETVAGGPVPRKVMMVAQQFGLSILLLLMVFALGNDIIRLFN